MALPIKPQMNHERASQDPLGAMRQYIEDTDKWLASLTPEQVEENTKINQAFVAHIKSLSSRKNP